MVSCRLLLQTYLIIKNIQAITFNLRTLIMIPDCVHLNPTALFYLFIYGIFTDTSTTYGGYIMDWKVCAWKQVML